ncbi:zinc finger protein 423-like [Mytilus californianus]|uniref:zinc finger protein 423-like n=1 Tax=Mytilus californianus TaxID=6549 RepID=UPI002245AC73|nr:zinc finger protein 423-like [Mytilus californianus]
MSRRKQARPRSFKREDEEDQETEECDDKKVMFDEEADQVIVSRDTPSEYNCDLCGDSFNSMDQFMDHRNTDCLTGNLSEKNSWHTDGFDENNKQEHDSVDSPDLDNGEDLSGEEEAMEEDFTPEQVPGADVVSENNPYGCQFCTKAFPRLSYLKIHEQIHEDKLPFKCDYCKRLFRHKRSRDRHVKMHTGDKKYKCMQCSSAFARSDHLKSHMKTHDSAKLYQCHLCNRGFTSGPALTAHQAIHKSDMESLQSVRCMKCDKFFLSATELQAHMSVHSCEGSPAEKVFQCTYCGEICMGKKALDQHVETSHMNDRRNQCPVCQKNFFSYDALCNHLSVSHRESPVYNPDQSPGKSKDMLVCPYCFCSDFDSLEVLELHMQSIHNVRSTEVYTCNYCNAPYHNLYSLHEHMRAVHQNQPCMDIKYPCTLCSRHFSSIESLSIHKKVAHYKEKNSSGSSGSRSSSVGSDKDKSLKVKQDIRPERRTPDKTVLNFPKKEPTELVEIKVPTYTASHLRTPNQTFSNQADRRPSPSSIYLSSPTDAKRTMKDSQLSKSPSHNRSSHQESITCDHCNATFYDIKNFQAHVNLHISSAMVQFTCKVCKNQFPTEEQLEKHTSTHFLSMTTEYGCTTCMKLFSKPDELQKHLMDIHAHHLFRCSLCKEIFDSKVNIQVHFAIKHSNECKLYKCTKCDSVFRSEMEWEVHVRVNHLHVAKPYRCLFCKESFTSEMDLQCHLTTHNKLYPCPMCEQSFHVEYLLDLHMQNAHGNSTDKQLSPLKIKAEPNQATPERSEVQIPQYSPSSAPGIWKNTEMLHTCNICDMKFAQQSGLMKHKAIDHGLSNKRRCMSPIANGDEFISAPKQEPADVPMSFASTSMSLPVVVVNDKFHLACKYCSQTFKNRNDLDKHTKIHLNNGNLKCNICDEVFETNGNLAEHKLSHCKIQQGNECVLCKIPLATEDQFYLHSQEHGFQSSYMQCIICRQTLVTMTELQMHGNHHFQMKSLANSCCVCYKSFDNRENLVSKIYSNGGQYFVCKTCYHGDRSSYQCKDCNLMFSSNEELDRHSKTHKQRYQCIKCHESFNSEEEIQAHVTQHLINEGNIQECKLCNTSFDSPAKLQCHLIEHTYQNSEYACIVCLKVYKNAAEIQAHSFEHDLEARLYHCSECSKKFFFSAELENHLYQHSTKTSKSPNPVVKSLNFKCDKCDKEFISQINLNNHQKIHEKREQNYKCSLCSEVFDSMAWLQQHFFSSHSNADLNTEKKTYKCTECGEEFACTSSLQGHMRIHKPGSKFPCPVCQKVFALARNLNIHMRSHSGEKPYECPVCHKRFARKENRKAHMRSHGGIKPFLCPMCGKSFTRKCHVKEHMRTHFLQDESKIESSDKKENDDTSQTGDLDKRLEGGIIVDPLSPMDDDEIISATSEDSFDTEGLSALGEVNDEEFSYVEESDCEDSEIKTEIQE